MKRTLVDLSGSLKLQLTESTDTVGGKNLIARGEFGRADVPTQNKRIYPRKIWEREIQKISEAIHSGKVLGHLNHPCLTSNDFRVFTVDGWKDFKDIKKGDEVYSLDKGKAIPSKVEAIIDQEYDGPVYEVTSDLLKATFTPAHRFILSQNNDRNKSEFYATIEDIANRREDFSSTRIPKTAVFDIPKSSFVIIPASTKANPHTKDLLLDAKVFASFMGIFLSDGYLSSDSSVHISQKNEWSRKYIFEVLSQFPAGLNWSNEKDGFHLADARLYRYLKPLEDIYTKFIPSEVKKLDAVCLREFIFWLKALAEPQDDISLNPDNEVFSVSQKLIQDIHECLVLSGGCGTVSIIETKKDYQFAGRTVKNTVPLYHIQLGVNIDTKNLKIEKTHHSGKIYCLTTTNGNFYMEAKGKSFWTGNSDGKTDLSKVSHIMTGLQMQDDGVIIGEAKILNNEYGNQLRSILEAGGAVGVSSRGMGSTALGEDGSEVVQDDYSYMTHDFVADPAVLTSYPRFQTEVKWIKPDKVVTETALPIVPIKPGSTENKELIKDDKTKLTPDEIKIVNHLESHPEIIEKLKTSGSPTKDLGSMIDIGNLGIDLNADFSYENVLDHFLIKHEEVKVEKKEIKTEVKAQDNNKAPEVQKPEEVKPTEVEVEVKKEGLPTVAKSPAIDANAELVGEGIAPESKPACGNKDCPGFFVDDGTKTIHKCDDCNLFKSDKEASDYVSKILMNKEFRPKDSELKFEASVKEEIKKGSSIGKELGKEIIDAFKKEGFIADIGNGWINIRNKKGKNVEFYGTQFKDDAYAYVTASYRLSKNGEDEDIDLELPDQLDDFVHIVKTIFSLEDEEKSSSSKKTKNKSKKMEARLLRAEASVKDMEKPNLSPENQTKLQALYKQRDAMGVQNGSKEYAAIQDQIDVILGSKKRPELETEAKEDTPKNIKSGEAGEVQLSLDDTCSIFKNDKGYYWHDKHLSQSSSQYFDSEKEAIKDAKENADIQEALKAEANKKPKGEEKFTIIDWAGNPMFNHKEFSSFEDAWDFLLQEVPEGLSDDEVEEHLGEFEVIRVGGKKHESVSALRKIIEAKDKTIEELGVVANRLGAHLHLERKASEMKEDRDELLKIIGKQKLESVKQVDLILLEAKKQLASKKEERRLFKMETKRIESKYESRVKAAEDKTKKLEEALRNTVSYSKEIGMRLYVSEKSRGNPNAIKIRELCEGKTDRKEVDSILERFKVVSTSTEDYNSVKRRFERIKKTSLVEDQLKENASRRSPSEKDEGVLDEMKDLFPGATLDQVESLM